MKILFATNIFPHPEGHQDGIFLYWRAKELIKKGHTVSVLMWNQEHHMYKNKMYNLQDLNNPILNEDIDVIPMHTYHIYNPIFRYKMYKKIKKNFDLVHFHWLWSMTLFSNIKKWNIPFVITCHGSDIYRMAESCNQTKLGRWINKKVMKYQMKRLDSANHTIFVSEDIKKTAQKKGSKTKYHSVIPNGYNKIFNTKNIKKNKDIIIGFVGNLIELKRADKVIDIFNHIITKTPIKQCIVIGQGHLLKPMKQQCLDYKIEKKVLFTGNIPAKQVAKYMKQMTVLILPSRQEAFGCVIKEAQACGTPVVGSNNGGIPAVIGRGGTIVAEGENFEERFANAVINLIKNPIDSSILDEETKEFTWENTVDKELKIYKSILSNN